MSSNIIKRFLGPMLIGLLIGTGLYLGNDQVSFNLEYIVKVFYTITYNYTEVLLFIAPMMIFIYVVNATNNLQTNASSFFKRYIVVIFVSLITLGMITLVLAYNLIPLFIRPMTEMSAYYVDPFEMLVLDLQPLFNITTGLFLAIFMGALIKSDTTFIKVTHEVEGWLNSFMYKIMLPLVPLWIFGTFMRQGFMNMAVDIVINDIFLSIMILIIQFTWLAVMGLIGSKKGQVVYKKVIKSISILFTEIVSLAGFGTGIIIPLSIEQQKLAGVEEDHAKIIASSSFNMPGSLISNIVFAMGVIYMFDLDITFGKMVVYVAFLIITLIAAPSVPGSVFAVTSTILTPLLGFEAQHIDIMGSLYYKQGTSNSATNHSADIYLGLILKGESID